MADTTDHFKDKRALLEQVLRNRLGQATTAASGIPRRTHDGPVPLSFAQQQFWLLSQLYPESLLYHHYLSVRMSGPLHIAALEQSLSELIRRHEAWRTSFPLVDGEPVQVIHPPSTFRLPFIDLSHLSSAEREAEVRRPRQDLLQVFDLTQAPPLRAQLVRLDDEDHCLFLILHHIIFDAFSLSNIFLPELYTLYQAFSAGLPSPLPELPIQYADYALWQRQSLNEKTLAGHLDYWKQHLAGAPAVLDLPTDHIRPLVPSYRGATRAFTVPAHLRDVLLELAQQEKGSLFMALEAVFATLLSRYSGQEDIVIGIPLTGRKYQEVQGLLGAFPNTLPLRTDLAGNSSFRELLRRVRKTTLDALDHDELPFEYLVKELHPDRSLGQNPLFQVMLTIEQHPVSISTPGWTFDQAGFLFDTSMVDLSLFLEDRPEGLNGYFEYSTDLFEGATIERLIGHWQTLLATIAADPERPLSQLVLLSEAERHQLLVEWNATQAEYPQEQGVHQLFEAQVERTPEVVALEYQEKHLTYRELNQCANQLAHHLQQLGVGPDVRVGLCMERSLEMVVGLLGILKAGGAYVPLDPAYPPERLAFMLTDAQVLALVTQQSLAAQLPAHAAKIVCLDADAALLERQSILNPASLTNAENLTYVLYTSGSTGKPKGVQVLQGGVVNTLLSMQEHLRLTAEDRLLAITTLSFDIATLEVLLPLIVGARLILASRETVLDGSALAEQLTRSGATMMQATPVTWRMLVTSGWQGSPGLKVLSGGESLAPDLAAQLLSKAASVWNGYGPTETTIYSTVSKVQSADDITIGRPLANTEIYLLDANLNPVPIGVPGELYIGGRGVARGYLNRPDLTAERFIPHPLRAEPGARIYRTGDLARYRADGQIEHLGRVDFQVKLRGFRIELGEIETTLTQHPGVRQAVVMAREDRPGDKRLVAYVVPHQTHDIKASELRSFLREYLPDYMIPSAFLVLEAFPQTPNGKIDRRALPAPQGDREQLEATFVAPRTPTEERLTAIWAELLGLKQVGINDNFFELGGHSLLAVRVLSQVRDAFQVELPLPSLFQAPTIGELAIKIVQSQADLIEEELAAQLLAELEQLSDHEVQNIQISEKQASGG